ncbi:MAG: PEP/pyruvate-binding domain-containing protein [Firmicutes bacterium]|nr:PEP/pyruvate-binding domain-containing protein [Bacillota bacterium]
MKKHLGEDGPMNAYTFGQSLELQTIFRIARILDRRNAPLDELLQRIAEELPNGFKYREVCRARIHFRGTTFASPAFQTSTWTLRAPIQVQGENVGEVEVVYLENRSSRAPDSPFHLDQKKLVDLTALKIGQEAESRLEGETLEMGRLPNLFEKKPEWRAILDLLGEVDTNLHHRLIRKLMNHATKLGVPGVHKMIAQFDPAMYAQGESSSHGSNAPLPKRDMAVLRKTFAEIQEVASIVFEDAELNSLLKQWMRQDKLGFLALATEKRDIPLVEITEIVDRFCRETREDEPALSPADDQNVRVALIRRFLTDNLKFIGIAKQHLSIYDFGKLLRNVTGPAQGAGKVGGKAAGLILAARILDQAAEKDARLERIRTPRTWYLTSDGIYNFLRHNSLEDLWSLKFSPSEEVRHTFPYLEQVFKNSFFSLEMYHQLQFAVEDLGEGPLIVRSSSLLEDSEGTAFSGKYRSLFLANVGSREERLDALIDAVAEVYASVFGPDPIEYRAERGLIDFVEEMGIIIQRVVGRQVGKYFFPAFAGVAFSHNEFRWSPRLKREDGIVRMVAGLGTRAVDRVGDDFPFMISPGQPNLRVNIMPDQVMHYAQTQIDVINLETGRFESLPLRDLIAEVGEAFPMLEKIVSVNEDGFLKKPMKGMVNTASDELVPTFAGLCEQTDFAHQVRLMLDVLKEAMGSPVDMEFAHDGEHLYLLQCRPQASMEQERHIAMPHRIAFERKIFSASKFVTNGHVTSVRYVVYVDPEEYRKLPDLADLLSVAEAVSRLNALLPRRQFILMGPGRWGSRGDVTLGVGITYSGINNTQLLVEIARKKGNYVPDLSFGTHFFQDLVEAKIRYLALYPDEEGNPFNEEFLQNSPNALTRFLPEFTRLDRCVRLIDVEEVAPGCELDVVMDGEKDRALGFLRDKRAHPFDS